jgi:hypothetical protein
MFDFSKRPAELSADPHAIPPSKPLLAGLWRRSPRGFAGIGRPQLPVSAFETLQPGGSVADFRHCLRLKRGQCCSALANFRLKQQMARQRG